jgi:ABC-type multidrug transport system fused ATPase/permease subunit
MLFLFPLLIIGMCLETLSVGMVIPAVGILLQPDYLAQFAWLDGILPSLGYPNREQVVIIGLVLLAGIFTIKNIFLFFQVLYQGTFVYSAQREVAANLFQHYLSKPYSFHLQTNSSVLIRNLTIEINAYCQHVLMPILNLISEFLVVIALLAMLILVEPIATLCLGSCLLIVALVFHRFTDSNVSRWGEARQVADEEKIKYLQQGFGGIKQIMLSQSLDYFLHLFQRPNIVSGLMTKKEYIFQYLPKQFIEILAIVGLVGVCVFMVLQGRTSLEVMAMLGLLATAGFRLIPSFSRILRNLQSIRFGWVSVEVLAKEMSRNGNKPENRMPFGEKKNDDLSFNHDLRLRDISFRYEQNGKELLREINFEVKKGECIGIVGESGAGKSTLTNLLLGLVSPSKGAFEVDGHEIKSAKIQPWQRMIGYVPQEIYLLDDTISRNIAFGVNDTDIDHTQITTVVEKAGIQKFIDNFDDGLNTKIGERGVRISGGQRQRIGIGRALYQNPQVLILDEATSSLDSKTEQEILNELRKIRGKVTMILVAHRQSTLQFCDKIFKIENGKIKLAS